MRSHEIPYPGQNFGVFVNYGLVAIVEDILNKFRACPAAIQRRLLVHIAGTRFVLKRGADYLQNAGADTGLAVRLSYGFFAGGQNYAAPGAQLLQAAVLTATALPVPLASIYTIFSSPSCLLPASWRSSMPRGKSQ